MSFTRRPGSGRPRQTSRRKDRHIVRNARVQPSASSATIQAQVASSLGTPVSSRTIRMRLVDGHLGSWHPLDPLGVLPLMPNNRFLRLEWCRARKNWTAAKWNQVVLSDESRYNLAVMIIVFVCGDLMVNASMLPLLYNDTPLPQLV
ncbi:transposable element Tcb2 transposase [Trichonephila clavipes]|nr:transposable element Tcb2 transposase [Trichonephila clavipes]